MLINSVIEKIWLHRLVSSNGCEENLFVASVEVLASGNKKQSSLLLLRETVRLIEIMEPMAILSNNTDIKKIGKGIAVSGHNGDPIASYSIKKLCFIDAFEWLLFVLSVESSGTVGSLARQHARNWPDTTRNFQRSGEITVNTAETGLEDAVGKEKLNVKLLWNMGHGAALNKLSSLAEALAKGILSL